MSGFYSLKGEPTSDASFSHVVSHKKISKTVTSRIINNSSSIEPRFSGDILTTNNENKTKWASPESLGLVSVSSDPAPVEGSVLGVNPETLLQEWTILYNKSPTRYTFTTAQFDEGSSIPAGLSTGDQFTKTITLTKKCYQAWISGSLTPANVELDSIVGCPALSRNQQGWVYVTTVLEECTRLSVANDPDLQELHPFGASLEWFGPLGQTYGSATNTPWIFGIYQEANNLYYSYGMLGFTKGIYLIFVQIDNSESESKVVFTFSVLDGVYDNNINLKTFYIYA